MRKTFLFYLFNKSKRALFENDNGFIEESNDNFQKPNGESAHLEVAPDGWNNIAVKYARNIKYWGMFRDFTLGLKFGRDGFKILRKLYHEFGIRAVAHLGISKLDRRLLPYSYLNWYLSDVDFTKYKEANDTVTINVIEGGAIKYLKAHESTVYEIPISADPEHINLYHDGMELENTATFVITTGFALDADITLGNHLIEVDIVSKEVEDIGGVFPVKRTKVNNSNNAIKATGKYIFKATVATQLAVEWDFTLMVAFTAPPAINPEADLFCVLKVIDTAGFVNGSQDQINLKTGPSKPVVGTHICKGSATINVNVGDEVYLYTFVDVEGATGDIQTEFTYGGTEPFLKLAYTIRYDPSYIECLTPYRLFEQIAYKMSNGTVQVKSDFLKGLNEILYSSGDAIRQNDGSVIKISWNDFYKSLQKFGVCAGVEDGVLRIEKIEYAFQDFIMADVGEVSDALLEPAEDLFFNVIKTGYNPQEYNGQLWSTPITEITKELDLTSPVRADAFGIELLRINFTQLKTTDSKADNETFMFSVTPDANVFTMEVGFWAFPFHALIVSLTTPLFKGQRIRISGSDFNNGEYDVVNVSGMILFKLIGLDRPLIAEPSKAITIEVIRGRGYKLRREAYSAVTGLLKPSTAFNIELSPKRAILANGAYIHSVLDKMEGDSITFTSADKNADLSTTLNGVVIHERENIPIASLPPKLFLPHYISFTTRVPINLLALMNVNPYGKIKFTRRSKTFYGFLVDGGITPATNDTQTWKLLSTTDNNLETFNNG